MKLIFNIYKFHPTAKYNRNNTYSIVPGCRFYEVADSSISEEYRNCIAFVSEPNYKKVIEDLHIRAVWQPYRYIKL